MDNSQPKIKTMHESTSIHFDQYHELIQHTKFAHRQIQETYFEESHRSASVGAGSIAGASDPVVLLPTMWTKQVDLRSVVDCRSERAHLLPWSSTAGQPLQC